LYFFVDRCDLKRRDLVIEAQQTMFDCLMYLFDKNHSDEPYTFVKLILVLTEFRSIRKEREICEEQWSTDYQDMDIPPLIKEIITLS
jgi:hypothetical protein